MEHLVYKGVPLKQNWRVFIRDLAIMVAVYSCVILTASALADNRIVLSDGTKFDPTYYAQNQDVTTLIEQGKYASYADHFLKVGFKEGRLPYEGAPDVTPARIILATNETRQKNGLASLTTDPQLCRIAQIRADEIAATGLSSFGHTRPNGKPWKSVYEEVGYQTELKCENLEWNEYSDRHGSSEVVTMWMNSPTHKQNLLDPSITKVGVAVAKTSDGKVIVAQEFAK